jgi:hypothetical protein
VDFKRETDPQKPYITSESSLAGLTDTRIRTVWSQRLSMSCVARCSDFQLSSPMHIIHQYSIFPSSLPLSSTTSTASTYFLHFFSGLRIQSRIALRLVLYMVYCSRPRWNGPHFCVSICLRTSSVRRPFQIQQGRYTTGRGRANAHTTSCIRNKAKWVV